MSKCVLITGASQGIGACIAERFAKGGYNVAINCRGEAEVENGGKQTAEKCRALGVEAECIIADVSKFDQCENLVNETVKRFGTLDVLVNNAGITRDELIVKMKEEQFDSVIAVNMKSVFNMMHFSGKIMMRAKHGKIVNIASVAGLYGNKGQINYSASKAGIVGMTLTAAKELGSRNINVNAVAPGFIETPMTAVLPDEIKQKAIETIPLRHFGTQQDVANAVFFLAGDEASFINGQVLVVDGGMIM